MNMTHHYLNTTINSLNAEIQDLKNRQTVLEIQLAHRLEEEKMRREFHSKMWNECWLYACMLITILLITIILHTH